MATLEGRITGDASSHLEAAEGYGQMGNASNRILALMAAARALVAAGSVDQAEAIITELAEFAGRNAAPGLLAGLPPGLLAGLPVVTRPAAGPRPAAPSPAAP